MFTEREIRVMSVLWKTDKPLTKTDILNELGAIISPSSIYPILNRLVKKGVIRQAGVVETDSIHLARTYEAILTQEEYAAEHIREITPNANFAGIYSSLLGSEAISRSAIKDLKKALDEWEEKIKLEDE